MNAKRVLRYYAECGRGFWRKDRAINHEKVCKCWGNPTYRTCKTCRHANKIHDSNGMEHEPQNLETWIWTECKKGIGPGDAEWNQKHENVDDININCSLWEPTRTRTVERDLTEVF